MHFPIDKSSAAGLVISGVLGFIFGILLNKGRVADYNVIVNFFRLRDLRMIKIMFTAVVVGGIGVFVMKSTGIIADWHIKPDHLLAICLGAAIFGVGMVLYGYCPGTAVAAVAAGSLHGVIGFLGMLAGGVAYAFSYPWLKTHVFPVGDFGKQRLPDITPLPDAAWYGIIAFAALAFFLLVEFKHLDRGGKDKLK
jgi:uncharacterized membrane protein YedE/YeeE